MPSSSLSTATSWRRRRGISRGCNKGAVLFSVNSLFLHEYMPTPTLYAAKRPISPENNTKVPLLLMNKYKIRPIPKIYTINPYLYMKMSSLGESRFLQKRQTSKNVVMAVLRAGGDLQRAILSITVCGHVLLSRRTLRPTIFSLSIWQLALTTHRAGSSKTGGK